VYQLGKIRRAQITVRTYCIGALRLLAASHVHFGGPARPGGRKSVISVAFFIFAPGKVNGAEYTLRSKERVIHVMLVDGDMVRQGNVARGTNAIHHDLLPSLCHGRENTVALHNADVSDLVST